MKMKILAAVAAVWLIAASFAAGLAVGNRRTSATLADAYQDNLELRSAAAIARSVSILEAVDSGKLDDLVSMENLRLDMALSSLLDLRDRHPASPLSGAPQAAVSRAQIYRAKNPRPPATNAFAAKRNKRVDEFLAAPK